MPNIIKKGVACRQGRWHATIITCVTTLIRDVGYGVTNVID